MADWMDSAVTELIPDDLEGIFPDPDVLGDPSVASVDDADVLDPSVTD
jgi:hypothetical protein